VTGDPDDAGPGGPADPDLPFVATRPGPAAADPLAVAGWFDGLMDDDLPAADGALATARRTAAALARRAKADNTRRAYRAGARAWCAWCARHDLPALPAAPADIAAFLSEQRYAMPPAKPLAVNTLRLRKAAIRYLHYLARQRRRRHRDACRHQPRSRPDGRRSAPEAGRAHRRPA
jgi:hypothetical protein